VSARLPPALERRPNGVRAERLGEPGEVRALDAGRTLDAYDGELEEVLMDAQIGDRITIDSNRVGGGRRRGEIVDIIAGTAGLHYRVRWDDGRETTFFPSSDATVEPAEPGGRRARRRAS
jgi:hypothetical protein